VPDTRGIVVSFVVCVLSILVGLAAFFWVTPPPRTDFPLARFLDGGAYEADPSAGYRPRPNLATRDVAGPIEFDVFTDSRGARISTPGEMVASPTVVITGASQAWGHGVQNEKTFAQMLGLPAVNLSVPSYGTASSLARLRSYLNLHPKFVIYAVSEQDFSSNVHPCIELGAPVCIGRPYVRFVGSQPQIVSPHTTAADLIRARDWFMQTSSRTEAYRTFFTDVKWTAAVLWHRIVTRAVPDPSFAEMVTAMNFLIDKMKDTADTMGAKFLVVYLPSYRESIISDPPEPMVSFLRARNIAFIPMADAFRDLRSRGASLELPDGHMNEVAHERTASDIRQALSSRFQSEGN
jgi:hypothetical protein